MNIQMKWPRMGIDAIYYSVHLDQTRKSSTG